VRSVIVLDDQSDDGMELEEPWEHVSSESEEDSKPLSYAEILKLK